jgi:hypothetical protein
VIWRGPLQLDAELQLKYSDSVILHPFQGV